MAKALPDAVDELIANDDDDDDAAAKIFDKWGVGGIEITTSTLNPPTSF
jgi:hypothetical protein